MTAALPGVILIILGCLAANAPAIRSIRRNNKTIERLTNMKEH